MVPAACVSWHVFYNNKKDATAAGFPLQDCRYSKLFLAALFGRATVTASQTSTG